MSAPETSFDNAMPADERMSGEDRYSLPPLLLQYWLAILRHRLIIAAIIGVCLAVGLAATLLQAPRYSARTQIEISRDQKNVTNVQGLESEQEGRDLEFYATQYSLLRAESLAQRVVRRLDLAKNPEFFKAHGIEPADFDDGASNAVAPSGQALKDRERLAVSLLLKNVEVEPIRTSRLVDIKYTSRSPEMSAKIANAWVQEFIGATMDRQFDSTAEARKFLEERLAALKLRLEQSERDAVVYASDKGIVALDATRDSEGRTSVQRTLASTDLEALNQALIEARANRIAAESKAKAGSAEDSPEYLTNPAITQLRARRAEVAAQYADLMVRFEPGYPAARALKEQIDSLDAALARETRRVSGSRNLSFTEARDRERALEAQVDALKGNLDRQRQDSIQFNIYQREADTNRQLYDALLQRYKEIGVAGTVGTSNIAIVDEARAPDRPSAPNMPLNLALALLIGVGLATVSVFALEQNNESLRNPHDVRNWLGLPLLGNVPLVRDEPLGDLENPKSDVAEAYFSIRSTLAFATSRGLPKSLAITSTDQGEGKSTTAQALAEIIGRTGKTVLLIDGDMRSPSLHAFLGISNEAGFSNLLAGEDDYAELIHETGKPGLSVLTSGPLPPSPPELLSSARLGDVLQLFLTRFDHVIIDAPPVLGLADALLIGRVVEGVVFVVEAEKTSRRAIGSALERLRAVGNHLFGAVVTKIDFSRYNYGYGYGYGGNSGDARTVR